MKTKRYLWMFAALVLVLFSYGYSQQSAEQLYRAGLYAEEVEGEL